jgi:hypothetical protein
MKMNTGFKPQIEEQGDICMRYFFDGTGANVTATAATAIRTAERLVIAELYTFWWVNPDAHILLVEFWAS